MSSIRTNFLYNSLYQILTLFIPIITLPYLSRVLGTWNIGVYSYHFTISVLFGIFIILGNANYGNRAIAEITSKSKILISETFWNIYFIQFFLGLCILAIYIWYTLSFSTDIKISLIQTIYLLSVILDINWLFYGLEKFKLSIIRNVIIKITTVIFIILLVKNKNDLYTYAFILSLSSLLSQLSLWFFIREYVHITPLKFDKIISHAKSTLALFIPVIAVSTYALLSKIILGSMSNIDEVGYFENSSRLIAIPVMAIWSLGTVMFPRISSIISAGQKDKIFKYIYISFLLSAFLSSSISFGIIGISNEFVPLFFGDNFDKCKILIPILVSSALFISWGEVIRTQYLLPNRKDKIYVSSVLYAAIINVIINIILVPNYGSIGSAIAILITEALICIIQIISVKNDLDIKKYILHSLFFISTGLIMCGIIIHIPFIQSNIITIIIKIALGIPIYIIPCYIYFKFHLNKKLKLEYN
ncbi:lipopolysaccharide biosynthesis protein [Avibacterium gallinarum]|uniref:lipopolysaccharide biosynthesis protein n=1 Tax=Avibacterium gallinarum TaxID=755 RepID=UPI003BF86500